MAGSDYDLPHNELLHTFARACAKSGASNSGQIIDVTGGFHQREAQYLGGVVLSKLEGMLPPFGRGDKVSLRVGIKPNLEPINPHGQGGMPAVWRADFPVIYRVHYESQGNWSLEFEKLGGWRYDAGCFAKAEPGETGADKATETGLSNFGRLGDGSGMTL